MSGCAASQPAAATRASIVAAVAGGGSAATAESGTPCSVQRENVAPAQAPVARPGRPGATAAQAQPGSGGAGMAATSPDVSASVKRAASAAAPLPLPLPVPTALPDGADEKMPRSCRTGRSGASAVAAGACSAPPSTPLRPISLRAEEEADDAASCRRMAACSPSCSKEVLAAAVTSCTLRRPGSAAGCSSACSAPESGIRTSSDVSGRKPDTASPCPTACTALAASPSALRSNVSTKVRGKVVSCAASERRW